jgi:hypothetical protein
VCVYTRVYKYIFLYRCTSRIHFEDQTTKTRPKTKTTYFPITETRRTHIKYTYWVLEYYHIVVDSASAHLIVSKSSASHHVVVIITIIRVCCVKYKMFSVASLGGRGEWCSCPSYLLFFSSNVLLLIFYYITLGKHIIVYICTKFASSPTSFYKKV